MRFYLAKKTVFRLLISLFFLLTSAIGISFAFANDGAATPPKWLSQAEINWLKRHPVIKVGPDPFYPPIEYFNQEGKFTGLAADYIKEIEAALGIKFAVVKNAHWDDVIKNTKLGNIDILSAAAATPSRNEYLSFTDPYLEFPAVIITRENHIRHTTMKELAGKKVAVTKGYAVAEYVKSNFPEIKTVEVPSIEEGLRALSFAELDAVIAINAPSLFYIEKHGYINLHLAGISGYKLKLAFAVRKDWPEFRSILQKTLDTIPPIKKQKIKEKWVSANLSPKWTPSNNHFLWLVIVIIAAALLATFMWNRLLKKTVTEKTEELHKRLKELEVSRHQTYQSEQRLRSIFNNAEIGLFIHALDGTILDMNDYALNMYGVKRDDIKNITVANNLSAADCPFEKIPEYWEKVLDGKPQQFSWHARRNDNHEEFNVEVTLTKLNDCHTDLVLASVRDFESEVKSVLNFRFLSEECGRQISFQLSTLQDQLFDLSPSRPITAAQISDLNKLSDESLEFAKDFFEFVPTSLQAQSQPSEPLDLGELCEQALKPLKTSLENKDLTIDFKNLGTESTIQAGKERLRKALRYLFKSTIVHADPNTIVTVMLSQATAADDTKTTELTVCHNGDSFTTHSKDIKFLENRPAYSGSIYAQFLLSQMLIESIGGTLSVESSPKLMTTFKVVFPSERID